MTKKIQNQSSNWLSEEENQEIHALLHPKSFTIATAVIELYCTRPPSHIEWARRDVGILCFVKDNIRKTYFFRMYCLRRKGLIWEQETYKDMEYKCLRPFFHAFEGDVCIYGFNFACSKEAETMKNTVVRKLEARRFALDRQFKEQRAKEAYANEITPKPVVNQKYLTLGREEKNKGKKQKDKKRRLTKADIGTPTGFQHIKHVSIDSTLDKDEMYQTILDKAGVDNKMLENRKTRELVFDFLDNYPNINKVKEQTQKSDSTPVVPKRSAPKPPQRAAPPAPKNKKKDASIKPPSADFSASPPKMAPPPPPLPPRRPPSLIIPNNEISSGGAAPPPPPPPPPGPLISSNAGETLGAGSNGDPRSALLASIREGASLKPVSSESTTNEPSRSNMLQQIKEGFALKPVSERELKPPTTPPPVTEDDIAFALKRVLESRSNAFRTEYSTSDTSDSDWDS